MKTTQKAQTNNLDIARRYVEKFLAINEGSVAEEALDPDFIYYTEISPDKKPIRGTEATKQVIDGLHKSFPDIVLNIEDIFAGEDRVVVRFKAVGTHKGPVLGIAPTGKQITFIETHVFRFRNGKIIEDYVSGNNYEFPFLVAPSFAEEW